MSDVLSFLKSWTSLLPGISFGNVVEILIIAVLVYEFLNWIMSTRAFTLLKGILVILVFTLFAAVFRLSTILWILEKFSTIAVIALVVIFQPELRKALENIGSNYFIGGLVTTDKNEDKLMTKESASMITRAVFRMGAVKTGALIVIEQAESLDEYVKTGIDINGDISTGLIINIFEKNTPLHDGAVIIRGNKILAATCYLPLSESRNISKNLGTRHRAALGMSEATDSVTIVVSEETGSVSYVRKGVLTHIADEKSLDDLLFNRINKAEVGFFRKLKAQQAENAQKNT